MVTGAPVLSVKPQKVEFRSKAGQNPPDQDVRVSGSWPKLAYRLTVSGVAWLAAQPEHGFTPREHSAMSEDIVHLHIDTVGLKPGRYAATVTVSSWEALEAPKIEVVLVVEPD